MSSPPPPIQCLFCNHLNPAGASFCNDCGSQMHLQPCDRCGAINKRTARNCYKCDAGFTLPATPELDPAPPDTGIAAVDPSAPADSAHFPPESSPAFEIVSSASAAPVTGTRRTVHSAVPVMMLVAMAMAAAGYYFFVPSAPIAKKQSAAPLAPGVSGTVSSVSAAPTIAAAPIEAASAPAGPTPKPAAGTSVLHQAPAPALPTTDTAIPVRRTPPTDAGPENRPPPPVLAECAEAVAALGLCNPGTKEETK